MLMGQLVFLSFLIGFSLAKHMDTKTVARMREQRRVDYEDGYR